MSIYMMLELTATAFFAAIVVLCVYFRRHFVKKSLHGCTVLVTNGDSDLSLNLANQLSTLHKCKVILVKSPSLSNNNDDQGIACRQPQSKNISTFECDILANAELDRLSKMIDKFYEGIDLIIDNGLTGNRSNRSATEFITSTSDNLRTTINLLMFFVPKMRYSLNGHVVSIQSSSNTSASKPLLDSSEIQRVVQLLASTDTQTYTNEIDVSTGAPVHIQRSTVLCDQLPNSKNLADVTEQIIAGIQHERSLIKIENSKSLIQFVCSFFFK